MLNVPFSKEKMADGFHVLRLDFMKVNNTLKCSSYSCVSLLNERNVSLCSSWESATC
jgi:hypothetical protein